VADAEARRGDAEKARALEDALMKAKGWSALGAFDPAERSLEVPWLRRMDIARETFRRTEPALALPLRASEYIRRQVKFKPFPTEPVGWMIEQAGEELFLFSSESAAAMQRFYSENFAEMMFLA